MLSVIRICSIAASASTSAAGSMNRPCVAQAITRLAPTWRSTCAARRIVSPLADSQIVPGEGRIGAGSVNGTGFVLNIEVVTRDATPIAAKESLNIRNTALLGQINPNIPGLYVFLDTDLVKPDGGVIPKNTNLANLFNILGTDDTPGAGVTLWLGWHVLESLPLDTSRFNITTAVVLPAASIKPYRADHLSSR